MEEVAVANVFTPEINSVIEENDAKNTKIVIKTALSVFSEYLRRRDVRLEAVESSESAELDRLLRDFYAEVRKPNGDYYAKKSLVTLRYGLYKHFLRHTKKDIIRDPAFGQSNLMFSEMMTKLKKEGKADVKHKAPITKEDLQLLYRSMDMGTPVGLQHKVFIDIMLYLCIRGRENLREFQQDEFHIKNDSHGARYVCSRIFHFTKNSRGATAERQPRMYEIKGSPTCPVSSFEKYLGKLNPANPSFWQKAKPTIPSEGKPWYTNQAIGKNALGTFMRTISEHYQLPRLYTNHCLRAASITTLDKYGLGAQHVLIFNEQSAEKHRIECSRRAGANLNKLIGFGPVREAPPSRMFISAPPTSDVRSILEKASSRNFTNIEVKQIPLIESNVEISNVKSLNKVLYVSPVIVKQEEIVVKEEAMEGYEEYTGNTSVHQGNCLTRDIEIAEGRTPQGDAELPSNVRSRLAGPSVSARMASVKPLDNSKQVMNFTMKETQPSVQLKRMSSTQIESECPGKIKPVKSTTILNSQTALPNTMTGFLATQPTAGRSLPPNGIVNKLIGLKPSTFMAQKMSSCLSNVHPSVLALVGPSSVNMNSSRKACNAGTLTVNSSLAHRIVRSTIRSHKEPHIVVLQKPQTLQNKDAEDPTGTFQNNVRILLSFWQTIGMLAANTSPDLITQFLDILLQQNANRLSPHVQNLVQDLCGQLQLSTPLTDLGLLTEGLKRLCRDVKLE
ncbi:uncharacterized protein LOC114667291 [Erpetoichthys calabaricus]|uniref:Uncharacterized LOC114667291 n=1 Tax=Erpetoichthys calabaricus TaxID=27687 RepID=A0A8C4TK95_ERPCA|nr:uncharacterized protein LOC114667291 [Erpetoichthys calabaricus]